MSAQPNYVAGALDGLDAAIARTVLYAALFDYPLTLAQLRRTLIGSAQTEAAILAQYVSSAPLRAAIDYRDGFFFPHGRAELIAVRRHRETRSRAFVHRHRLLLTLVAAMPYVRLLAVSGSVAHLNLDGDGDLDLFVIARGRRVWSVAVAVVLLAKILGQRRTVCANFVLADGRMALDQRDLFTANQIIHLKPLAGADALDEFMQANPFVAAFYPNAASADATPFPFRPAFVVPRVLGRVAEYLLALPSAAAEAACRRAYGWHLRRRAPSWQSPDQVRLERDCLKLHTRSHRRSILHDFDSLIRKWL